jgi:hypothetical protein
MECCFPCLVLEMDDRGIDQQCETVLVVALVPVALFVPVAIVPVALVPVALFVPVALVAAFNKCKM